MAGTHVCLVSDQLIPNVLPVLKEKPQYAVLLATSQMEARTSLASGLRDCLASASRVETTSTPERVMIANWEVN